VVDRMGTDSFTPDSGVLLAKTKNQDRAPFEWVVDANPQDIKMTDYVLPDGTEVPITIGDYRQLSDALFHAGTNSGSEYEYTDTANRLHFYITNIHRTGQGGVQTCDFNLTNTGQAGTGSQHPEDVTPYLKGDVYRVSATVDGKNWNVQLPNALATADAGQHVNVPVYAKAGTAPLAKITLTATSESDPTKKSTATCLAIRR
jgi:hypothetical protein